MDEVEGCDMHNSDKIIQSAIGELFYSKIKFDVNHFEDGKGIAQNFNKMGFYFSSNQNQRDLLK